MDKSFNFCVWNLRGLNHLLKQKALKNVMQKHCCSVGGSLEARLKQEKFDSLKSILENWWSVDSNISYSINCRVLIVWDSDQVSVDILEKHEHFIHCKVQTKDLQWDCFVTFVYALNLPKQRVSL